MRNSTGKHEMTIEEALKEAERKSTDPNHKPLPRLSVPVPASLAETVSL
jgi:hypothetical protein